MREYVDAGENNRGLDYTLWALQITAALAFCLTGAAKLVGAEAEVQLFAAVGFGQWFRYVTGAMELLGALMLVFPGTAFLGACLLALVMAGATMAHLTLLGTPPALPLVLLLMMGIIAWGRHKRKVHLERPTYHPL